MPQIRTWRTWKTPPNKLTMQQRLIQGRMDRDPPRRRGRKRRSRGLATTLNKEEL